MYELGHCSRYPGWPLGGRGWTKPRREPIGSALCYLCIFARNRIFAKTSFSPNYIIV